MSDQPLNYDTVAVALLNAFSKADMEDEKDNSLAIFLGKLYKNNTSSRPKRMNSIRINRYNAFLYRVTSALPQEHQVYRVVHASLLAFMVNDRNFEEEEDEEVLMSIARWACQLLLKTLQAGFHELVLDFLRYLIKKELGQTVLPSPSEFEELVKECAFFTTFELCAEDERKAFLDPLPCSITSPFSLLNFILEQIDLKTFYQQLFKAGKQGKEVIELFSQHLKKSTQQPPGAELFLQIFFTEPKQTGQHLGLLLQHLEQHCMSIDGLRSAINHILNSEISLKDIFKLEPQNNKTFELLLEMLKDRYSGDKISEVIQVFLSQPVSNMIAPCLLSNSDCIPEEYLDLLFKEGQFCQRQVIVLAFTLVHHHSGKLPSKLMGLWEQNIKEGSPARNSLFIRSLYCSLCETDKTMMLSKVASSLSLDTINGPFVVATLPVGILKAEKLRVQDKNLLSRILFDCKIEEDSLPLKIELQGLCGQNMEMTRRIKYLVNLFTLPVEQILKAVPKEPISKDPMLMAVVLMGINNRIEVTFIEEPDQKALDFLAKYYIDGDSKFGAKLGEFLKEKPQSPISDYLLCLSRFNLLTGQSLGGFPQPLDSLLSGNKKYNRLIESDFSGYFYRQESNEDLVEQLSTQKKILMEIRRMLRKLLRKQKHTSDTFKEVLTLLGSEWSHLLAIKLIHAYFQAVVDNPAVLKQILGKVVPQFSFFERMYTLFQSQNEEYVDFLAYLPKLLNAIYPEALDFMSRLMDSQPGSKKEKEKKGKGKKKKHQDKGVVVQGLEDGSIIFDTTTLFEYFRKTQSLGALFGDPSTLQSFDKLFKIVTKLPKEDVENIKHLVEEWLQMICIFHPQQGEEMKWRNRVLSYCRIWKNIFFDLNIKLTIDTLRRHFDILAELLNIHYETKNECQGLEEQLLITLLLVLQAAQTNFITEPDNVPIETIRNCLLGFRLPIPYEQHFFNCNTCSLSVCQVCAPFLHKHHDLSYIGKDGNCVHDSSQKKVPPAEPERNVFGAPQRPRREQDLFALNFDLGEDEMDMSEQMRFKELMEYRLHEQRRERQRQAIMKQRLEKRDHSHSREQNNFFLKKSNDIVNEALQQEEASSNDILNQIKSENSKSICNIEQGFTSHFTFQPEFAPVEDHPQLFTSPIDARPLRHILMRELQQSVHSEGEKTKLKGEVSKERYNFFKQSAYFKGNRGGDYGGMVRGYSQSSMTKRNLLTASKKFVAFPSATNGIVMMSVGVLGLKLQSRQVKKAMNDFEQERTYLSNAINNSNLAFDPYQLTFGRGGILAVIGLSQLGFFILNQDGKVQKFVESDLKCAEPITKFQWINKQKSNVFSLSYGNCVRMGSLTAEDLRVRTSHRLKIQIDKVIRDFEMSLENHCMTVYVLDNDGALYKGDFDFKDTKTISIADKRVQNKEMGTLASMILFGKFLLVSAHNGKLHLLRSEGKGGLLTLLQSYDLQNILKNVQTKLKGVYCMLHPKLIQTSDNITSICCLLSKSGEGRKRGSALAILRFTGPNNDFDIVILSEEETVEHFDILEIGENNYALMAIEESGTVWVSPYSLSSEQLSQREESKLPISEESLAVVNNILRNQKVLSFAKICQPRRCDTFKETKEITGSYATSVEYEKVTLRAQNSGKFFINGLSLFVETNEPVEMQVVVQGEERRFALQKGREIQLGLSLKETLLCFIEEPEIVINYRVEGGAISVKGIKVFGVEFGQESVYKSAYSQVHRLITIHYLYDPKNLVHYLQNPEKNELPACSLTELETIKTTHKYSHKEITLLMKLELLRMSTSKALKNQEVEEMLLFVREDLLPQSEKRHFLEKSCWRLMKHLCYLILPQGNGRVGHPFEFRTSLDFYYYNKSYSLWNGSRQLSSFQKLVTFLYSLIFKRISNLYLILRMHPNLIYELTFFYKNALHSLKQSGDPAEQIELAKLINICPSYVALVCEYYQTLKNVSHDHMVDEKESCPEKVVLDLLEEVFCATKKELYRQIFVSPELYLDKLYLTSRKPLLLTTSIDLFSVREEGQPSDHASRKASIGQQEIIQSEEEDFEGEEEQEEKEMLEEEAREMPEMGQALGIRLQARGEGMVRQFPRDIKKLTSTLTSYLLPHEKKVNFIYYQFSFQMLTALFKLTGYLTKQNAVFYLGFAFNLLRIIEFNSELPRDQEYFKDFFSAVMEAVQRQEHSLLFLVVNYFLEPTCGPKDQQGTRTLKASKSKLSRHFIDYLVESKTDVESIMTEYRVSKISSPVTMTKAMKFVNFELENQWYQLKFLGNLFVLLRNSQHPQFTTPSGKLKNFVLSIVVRHKLRVFGNIMVAEKWWQEMEEAKIDVGFETVKDNPQEGIKILYDCATKKKEIFVRKLASKERLIAQLEDLLGTKDVKEELILEMLNIYYQAE